MDLDQWEPSLDIPHLWVGLELGAPPAWASPVHEGGEAAEEEGQSLAVETAQHQLRVTTESNTRADQGSIYITSKINKQSVSEGPQKIFREKYFNQGL